MIVFDGEVFHVSGFGANLTHVRLTVEWAKAHVREPQTLFITSELEAKLDVSPWRPLSYQIYQSQLYPWIEAGYRRYQHLSVMDFIVCTAPQVQLFLATPDSLLSQQICKIRPSVCRWSDVR